MKYCSRCQLDQPVEKFARNSANPDGLQSWCSPCLSKYSNARYHRLSIDEKKTRNAKSTERRKRRQEIDPDYREQLLENNFYQRTGVSRSLVMDLLVQQGGICAICQTNDPGSKGWHLDHDHRCCSGGKLCVLCARGVLCSKCNHALGLLGDDPQCIIMAASYLVQFRGLAQIEDDDKFHGIHNAVALGHLKAALEVLQERTRDREQRGVEGTHST